MRTLIVSGRLYRDPESKTTNNNRIFCSFAISDTKKRNGQDDIMWCRVTVFGKTAESCMQYLHAGDSVTVVGEPSIYIGKDSKASIDLIANQVEFGPKGNGGNGQQGGNGGGYQQQQRYGGQQGGYAQQPQQPQGGYQQPPPQQQPVQQQPDQPLPPAYNPPAGEDDTDSPF